MRIEIDINGNITEHDDVIVDYVEVVSIPQVVSMRQAKQALLQQGLLATINNAIASGTDEGMKIDWEYATEVRRDWDGLVTIAASLGMTDKDLDNLFTLASTK